MTKTAKLIKTNKTYQIIAAVIVIIGVAVLGYNIINLTHAQTPFASSDAANGQIASPASLISGGSNSNGQAVQFGSSSTGGSSPGSGTVLVGDYDGYANPSGVASFASETGTKVSIAGEYLDGTSWSSIEAGISTAWENKGYQMAIGVDMLPNSGASLADGAAGDYNSDFTTLAKNLVAQGAGNAILHIGWEWDQSGNPWYVSNTTDASNFAAYWRQIVTSMRAVSGANFNYAWYYGDSGSNITTAAYPGSSYVSSIDLDFYDQSWDTSCGLAFNNTSNSTESQCIWNGTMVPLLTGYASFATTNNEPMGFGEWGVISRSDGHGLGDDPLFISNFAAWINTHNVEYLDYFDYNSGGNSVLSSFPNSLAQYKKSILNLTSTYKS